MDVCYPRLYETLCKHAGWFGSLVMLTPSFTHSGSDGVQDPTLSKLLSSGITSPPPDDVYDLPRVTG